MSTAVLSPFARQHGRNLTGLAIAAKEAVADDTVALTLADLMAVGWPIRLQSPTSTFTSEKVGSATTRCVGTAGTLLPIGFV